MKLIAIPQLCAKSALKDGSADAGNKGQQARWRKSMASSDGMDVEMSESEKVRVYVCIGVGHVCITCPLR